MFEARIMPAPILVDLAAAMRQPAVFRRHTFAPSAELPLDCAVDQDDDDAYSRGVAEGRRLAEISFAVERKALLDLLRSCEALSSEPCNELAEIIGAAVLALVETAVGAAPVDRQWLLARVKEAAATISEADKDRVLRLHPDDAALLSEADLNLPIRPDLGLARGSVLIATGDGWVENGRPTYLAAIRAALMGENGQ